MKQILKDKVFLLALICVMFAGNIMKALAFEGSTPTQGQKYYLYNIYQAKFLGADSKLDNASAITGTVNSDNQIVINGTSYSLSNKDGYYQLKSGANFYAFEDKVADPDNPDDENRAMYPGGGVTCKLTSNDTDRSYWQLVSEEEYAEWQSKKKFTVAALNVDGMPKSITVIELNPDAKEGPGATAIGKRLATTGWDVVGVSEDFNFHKELFAEIDDIYDAGSHRGILEYSAGLITKLTSQQTLFDTDGLCFFTKKGSALMQGENWVKWNDHYGYTGNGADGLIAKGYRYYKVRINDEITVDVYTTHMDADSDPEDNAARAKQLTQLVEAVKASNNKRPIIIIGDTNCRYTRDLVKTNLIDAINADSRFTIKDTWIEFGRGGVYPTYGSESIMAASEGYLKGEVVDKIFYINNTESPVQLKAETYCQDLSFVDSEGSPLCDHKPCVVTFSYEGNLEEDNSRNAYNWVGEKLENGNTYYIYNVGAKKFLKGNAPVSDYNNANTWTVTVDGSTVKLYNNADKKVLYAKRNSVGFIKSYSIEYDTSNNTVDVNNATTSTQGVDYLGIGYKIHGADNRQINVDGNKLTSAESTSAWNDWLFISPEQMEAKKPVDYVENSVHYYSGIYQSQPTSVTLQKQYADLALDIDISKSNITNVEINVDEYPNAIIYANKDSKVKNTQNVVIDGAAQKIVITDGKQLYVPYSFSASDASYTRTVSGKWGTVVFPAALTSNANDNGIQYYELDSKNEDASVLYFSEVNVLQANKPGAFIASKTGNVEFVGGNAIVNETGAVGEEVKAASNIDGWNLVGAYQQVKYTSDLDTKYYISGDQFRTASKSLTINPFRAYFDAKGAGPGAKNIAIGLYGDEEATRVSEITGKPTLAVFTGKGYVTLQSVGDNDVKVYGVSGNLVGKYNMKANESATINLPAGVYVVGGKKVLVK